MNLYYCEGCFNALRKVGFISHDEIGKPTISFCNSCGRWRPHIALEKFPEGKEVFINKKSFSKKDAIDYLNGVHKRYINNRKKKKCGFLRRQKQ